MITKREEILIDIINAQSQNNSSKARMVSIVNRKESYPYIPYHLNVLFEQLLFIKEEIKKEHKTEFAEPAPDGRFTFIDYGAGTGLNMYLALLLGFKPFGIEIDKEVTKYCGFNTHFHMNFIIGDLNNKKLYKKDKYDVVFFYSPFFDREKEISFELEAIKTVKVGGYVIAPSPGRFQEFFHNYKKAFTYELKTEESQTFNNQMKKFKKIDTPNNFNPIFKRIK